VVKKKNSHSNEWLLEFEPNMKRLKTWWTRFLERCAWAMLRAAGVDNRLMAIEAEMCAWDLELEPLRDQAALIPRRLAEFSGGLAARDREIGSLKADIKGLERELRAFTEPLR
jgi:hypothetical protein